MWAFDLDMWLVCRAHDLTSRLSAVGRVSNIEKKASDTRMVAPGGRGVEGSEGKGVKYMVMEDDLALGGEHTAWNTDHVSQNRTLTTYVVLLTNVILMSLI